MNCKIKFDKDKLKIQMTKISIFKGMRDRGSIRLFYIKEFLPQNLKIKKINTIFSSSNESTELLENLQFEVTQGAPENFLLDYYIDGADEIDKNYYLIKGGGGAHRKKKYSQSSIKKIYLHC